MGRIILAFVFTTQDLQNIHREAGATTSAVQVEECRGVEDDESAGQEAQIRYL